MAGKRLAKLEKKALPRVETTEKSRMAGKRLAKFGEKGATESKPQRRAEWLAKGGRTSRKRRYRESNSDFFASGGACGGLRFQ